MKLMNEINEFDRFTTERDKNVLLDSLSGSTRAIKTDKLHHYQLSGN